MRPINVLFLSLLLTGLAASQNASNSFASPLIGRPAFDFQLTDTFGQRLKLSSLKGNVVVLEFWTTWCPPCREEASIIDQVAKSFSGKRLAVLGIDALEDPETVREFLKEHPVSYRTLLTYDDDSTLGKYGVRSFPFTVILDRNGTVVEAGNHPPNELSGFLRNRIISLLRTDYRSPERPQAATGDEPLTGVICPKIPDLAQAPPIPHTPDEFFLRASLDFRMNRLVEALNNVNACLDQSKDWAPALRLRARIYSKQGKRNEAVADYTRILGKSPTGADVYGLRASLFHDLNQPDKALDDYERETRLDPNNAEAWIHLAGAYLANGRLDPARKAVDQSIAIAPDNVSAYQIRAQVEKQKADWKGELADIERMLILEPNNSWAKTYRPDVLLRIAQVASPISQDDTYAVYSAVLLHPIWNHVDNDSLLLISEVTSAAGGGMDPAHCIRAPSGHQTELDQALGDYTARKSLKAQLRPDFRITRPYRLLTERETEQFVNFRFRRTVPDSKLAPLFEQSVDVIRLSPVFFDKNHTLALVLVSNYCGGLCGGAKWRVLRKHDGIWLDQDWVGCLTVS